MVLSNQAGMPRNLSTREDRGFELKLTRPRTPPQAGICSWGKVSTKPDVIVVNDTNGAGVRSSPLTR